MYLELCQLSSNKLKTLQRKKDLGEETSVDKKTKQNKTKQTKTCKVNRAQV